MISTIKLIDRKEDFDKKNFKNTFFAKLDGKKCPESISFYKQLSKIFDFPDYFGKNLDAVYDCLLDLVWILEPKVVLIIENFDDMFSEEEHDPELLEDFVILLDEVVQSWKVLANDEEDPKKFSVYFIASEKAKTMLEENGIQYSD